MKRHFLSLAAFVLLTWAFAPEAAAQASAGPNQDQVAAPAPLQRHPVDLWEPTPPLPPQTAPETPILELSTTTWTSIGPSPLAVTSPANANSNVSGRITAVAADPTNANTIYIATAGGGVWKTTDGGTTWNPLTDTQRTLSMGAIAVARSNPSVIYAGTGEANNSGDSNYGRGILVSTNGGNTWTLSTGPANAFDRLATAQISVDPTNPNIAYAAMQDFANNGICCANTGVYKTIDGGITWTNTTTTIDSIRPWSAVIVDPITPATAYSAHGEYDGAPANGVYKSVNSGGTWPLLAGAPSGTATGRFALALAPSNTQVLYATITNPTTFGLFKLERSDNAGMSFNDLTAGTPNYMGGQGWYDTTLIVDPANSAIVYVAGSAGTNSILRSTTSGVSWTDIHTGGAPNFTSPHVDHHGTDFDANGRLLLGTDGGIYRLDTPPTSWSDLNGNLSTIQFTGIGLHPTNPNIVVGGSQDNGTELYTGNPVWTERDGGDGGYAKFSPTNGNRVYHQIPNASAGSAFFRRSDDGGNTWATKTNAISTDTSVQNFYAPFSVDPTNGDRVLYGTNRVWETTNGGDIWTPISASGSSGFNSGGAFVDAIGIAPDLSTLYVATGGTFATSSKIFVTNNHGAFWTEHDLPAGTARVNDLQVESTNAMIVYAVVNDFSANGHVFRTTNGGISWSNISGTGGGALPNLPVWSIQVDSAATPSRLYIGVDDGVYSSSDLGVNWSRLGTGLPNVQAVQIELNKTLHILGVATHGRGAWEIQTPAGGPLCTNFYENFDGVTAPTLPAGWSATNVQGPAPLWTTATAAPDTAPNYAFIDDPNVVSDKNLDTPGIPITSTSTRVSFRHSYNLESTFDGGVLEVSSPNINGGTFTDITNAAVGGSFVTGGYNATISTQFMSPIAGRMAWSGISGGYVNAVANPGPNVVGQTIRLRFRMASDASVGANGWSVDSFVVQDFACPLQTAVSRKVHTGVGPFDINLPVDATTLLSAIGIECRSGGGTNDFQVVLTFSSPVTFTGAAVTAGTGSVSGSSGSGTTAVTVNLTGVTNAQRITVTLQGVSNGTSTGDVSLPIGMLLGDTNGDGTVNSGDIGQTKSRSGQAVDATNFREDVNVDGSLNSADISLVKNKSGTGLP